MPHSHIDYSKKHVHDKDDGHDKNSVHLQNHEHNHHHIHPGSDKNILIALVLNLIFSVVELLGGIFTNSVAITSDSVHSFSDALSTGIAFVMERLSHKKNQPKYSLYGGLIVSVVLIVSAIHLIAESIERFSESSEVSSGGMIIFAILGIIFNFLAALATMRGTSFNQKAVYLHMLEDTFGWIAVLLGAVVMHFTGFTLIDPVMSIVIALYIIYRAILNVVTELRHVP